MVESSVSMALSDFYAINSHYTKRLSLSFRDSHGDPLVALSSGFANETALDLLQNVGVEAIIGGLGMMGRLGMMGEGFVWILTAKSINSFHENTDDFVKEAMEGVVGFKSYIPMSKELHDFTWRWIKSLPVEENVGLAEMTRLSISGVWAHDIACALARAAEVVASMSSVSSTLLEAITETSFKGLSGDFQLVDKKLLSNKFEIVNMVGSGERGVGFWNSNGSFSNRRHLSSTHNELDTIIWPGGSAQSPKWRNEREGKSKKLRVLVTSSNRFPRLMKYIRWLNGSDYDNLAYALYTQKDKYDAAVGDTTITPNRMKYADFTIPFTEMGLGIVAPKETSMWVFFRPLTPDLWITSAAFFALTGIIVWLIERSENTEFQGSWSQQIGVMLWYGFSTLVYAHRERLKHNLSRFVVTVWVFAVLILTTSYNATLTSIMTVQEIRLNSNKDYVGHLSGSLIASAVLTNSSLRMFQKGHELVSHVSREISILRTSERLNEMEKRWFNKQFPYATGDTADPKSLYMFRGLFMVTGVSFAFAITVLVRDKWKVLVNSDISRSSSQKLSFQIASMMPLARIWFKWLNITNK
ncbi:unnamed protein product [Arabis nemorensis]|uniref:Ionotropic glutamate receptor C-terminal domain-containing protein n=1 Tax=Arabis nemorensis TaxID=586526 RepID=A0A565CH37_9BRAS|nr:unnamed protein product [Arabis nemorensis]